MNPIEDQHEFQSPAGQRDRFCRCTLVWAFRAILVAAFLGVAAPSEAASRKGRNVFFITTDGLRWQEVFTGAQEGLMNKSNGVAELGALRKAFWRDTPEARRQALFPFLWSVVASNGQIYGNAAKGSVARITNDKKFSYPGYSEFLTGAADSKIDSNKKIPNPHTNVFEWLNTRPDFKGRVAAIVNWDVIPWILNTERARIPCWSGFPMQSNAPAIGISPLLERLLNDTTPLWHEMILDTFTIRAALDYVQVEKPRAFYLAFAETDEWAHEVRYDYYLHSAHHVDRFIRDLWEACQRLPEYRDKTTFIITTDHGRGDGADWTSHGEKTAGAEFIWAAILGPDTPPLGERTKCAPITQSQMAATIAAALGEDFPAASPRAAAPIAEAFVKVDN
jgi:hypothetical protein